MKDIIFWVIYQFAKIIPTNGIPVLLYHSISDNDWEYAVSPKEFEKQINWICKHYIPIKTSDIITWLKGKKKLPKNAICITFDDGYQDNIKRAYLIMKKYKIPATVFVIANLQEDTGELQNQYKLMNNKELQILSKNGWEIQSHSFSHPKLTRIKEKEIEAEVKKSKKVLSKITSNKITMFAYPKSSYNQKVKAITKKYYQAAWTIKPGFVRKGDDLFTLKRILVKNDTSIWAFKAHLTKPVEWINTVFPK